MNEIDCIHISKAKAKSVITGISYNCCSDTLAVSFENTIVDVKKQNETSNIIFYARNGLITGVLSLSPGIIVTIERNQKQYIEIYSHGGEETDCYCLGDHLSVRNLIFDPCQPYCVSPKIEAFVLKKIHYPFLCDLDIPFCTIGFMPNRCNFEICKECCCEKSCKKKDPCAEIMESIAHVETALSHILNAEGEKLQKIISETDDIETILYVNREVNKTIINVTHLEQVLYSKLAALADIELCGDPCDRCRDKAE